MESIPRLPQLLRLLCIAVFASQASCGGSGGGGKSPAADGILWNSQSGSAGGGPGVPGGTLWVDPNTGIGGLPTQPDPQDIRTYTRPDIYILGNKHPLQTDVTTRTSPYIIIQEDRVTFLLNAFRYNEYVRLVGLPVPGNSRLLEHTGMRQIARAHAKHYAVWHSGLVLPLTNAEGDSIYYINPAGGAGNEVAPDGTKMKAAKDQGRLYKCMITTELAGQLVASGVKYRMADDTAAYFITTYPDFLRLIDWTHIGVGFWEAPGTSQGHYWNVICAKNPKPRVAQPTIPLPIF